MTFSATLGMIERKDTKTTKHIENIMNTKRLHKLAESQIDYSIRSRNYRTFPLSRTPQP